MTAYDKPPELYDGLRLHQNENTLGCSPRVIEALARLRPTDIGFYPPYTAVTETCARYFGVSPDRDDEARLVCPNLADGVGLELLHHRATYQSIRAGPMASA